MMDVFSKVVGILLAFFLLVIAPIEINSSSEDAASKRIAINEVEAFLDKVCDKGSVTLRDVDDLSIGVNSYSMTFDVCVYRYQAVSYTDAGGVPTTKYILCDSNLNRIPAGSEITLAVGDMIQVCVSSLDKTQSDLLLGQFLRYPSNPFEFTLSARVR